jgi:GNAT superfamily N-acetyltransferase
MEPINNQWPEIKSKLPTQLQNDPYIESSVSMFLHQPNALQIKNGNMLGMLERPYGMEMWFEAFNDDARMLLQNIPVNKKLNIAIGNALGLRLVQEELDGFIKPLQIFCFVNQTRFRPQKKHPVTLLTKADRDAIVRYAQSHNAKVFLHHFDEGTAKLYGAYSGSDIVGCCSSFDHNYFDWFEVKPEFRGQGYGRSLISACVTDLLVKHRVVYHDVCMDDMSTLRAFLAAGFTPLRQTFYFTGQRQAK